MLYFLCVVSLVSAIPANNLQSSTLVADSESCSWTRPCLGDSLECKFVQVCSNTSTSSNTNENLVSGQAFVIDFKCAPSVPEILCLKAQATIISASKRIEKVLVIQNTIRVQATFRPFCNGVSTGCQFDNTLGQAAPGIFN